MQNIVKNIVGPKQLVYTATFAQADSKADFLDVLNALALSVDQFNAAVFEAKKEALIVALDSTVDSKIELLFQSLVNTNTDPAEARVIAESRRPFMTDKLPDGVSRLMKDGVQVVSKRGIKKSDDTPETPETPSSEAPVVPAEA